MNDKAKNILLYGDSFFWGLNPSVGKRYKPSERIGIMLQEYLGDEYKVIEEGLRGRTMFGENGWFPERDGLSQFGPIFASQLPVDIVVIMLGTNDLNSKAQHSPKDIASALREYNEKIIYWCDFMKCDLPRVIIISPPDIDTASLDAFKEVFRGSAQHIEPLTQELSAVSKDLEYGIIDSKDVFKSRGTDGIHVTSAQNGNLAAAIKNVISS